jgi:uncharacterized BrkB/YihY/UPF0761 family membrane protein
VRSDILESPIDIEETLKIAVFGGFVWSVSNLRLAALMMLQAFCPLQTVSVPCKVINAFTAKFSEALNSETIGLVMTGSQFMEQLQETMKCRFHSKTCASCWPFVICVLRTLTTDATEQVYYLNL